MSAPHGTDHRSAADKESLGALVHDLSEQTSALVRSEIELAKAELAVKGKNAGMGAGLFGVSGILGLFGLGVLITTAILALALVLPAWAAALIVAVVLFIAAGIAALVGKGKVSKATPAAPERAVEGVKQDVETIKGGHGR